MKLKQSKYFIDNQGIDYKFAWFPVQLGLFNSLGYCYTPHKRIWLEWYKQEWVMKNGIFYMQKQIIRKFQ